MLTAGKKLLQDPSIRSSQNELLDTIMALRNRISKLLQRTQILTSNDVHASSVPFIYCTDIRAMKRDKQMRKNPHKDTTTTFPYAETSPSSSSIDKLSATPPFRLGKHEKIGTRQIYDRKIVTPNKCKDECNIKGPISQYHYTVQAVNKNLKAQKNLVDEKVQRMEQSTRHFDKAQNDVLIQRRAILTCEREIDHHCCICGGIHVFADHKVTKRKGCSRLKDKTRSLMYLKQSLSDAFLRVRTCQSVLDEDAREVSNAKALMADNLNENLLLLESVHNGVELVKSPP